MPAFYIGWTVNCASEVVYEKINPVPEPKTMPLPGGTAISTFSLRRLVHNAG